MAIMLANLIMSIVVVDGIGNDYTGNGGLWQWI